jgi:hypothetical protein
MIAGLLLAVGCAVAGSVGVLLKQRGAVAAPAVLARHPCAAQSTCLARSGGRWAGWSRWCVAVARREAALPSGSSHPAGAPVRVG